MEIRDLDKIQNISMKTVSCYSIFGRARKYAYNRNMAFCKFQFISVGNFTVMLLRGK